MYECTCGHLSCCSIASVAAVNYELCGRHSAAYRVHAVFLITYDGRTRSPDAPHSADQVASGCAVNTADGTAVDDARRSAFVGPPCGHSSSKGHLRAPSRSMTSWRVDGGQSFVFHAGDRPHRTSSDRSLHILHLTDVSMIPLL